MEWYSASFLINHSLFINPNRGTKRFASLLSMLGLLDRMITCSTELNQFLLSDTIVWNKVNDVINIKRNHVKVVSLLSFSYF